MDIAAKTPLPGRDKNTPATRCEALTCSYCHLPIPGTSQKSHPSQSTEELYCCYGCRFAAGVTQARGEEGQVNWLLTRLGVAVFLSMGVMVFTMFLYGQEVYRVEDAAVSPLEDSLTGLMRYLSLVFATPVFFILGWPILAGAIQQFRNGIASTDLLVVIGVAAAYLYSYISTLTNEGSTYYETACMILVLVTLGRWLEASGKLKAARVMESLTDLLPQEAAIRQDGQLVTVNIEDIKADDMVVARPGQRVPVDGIIEEGQSTIDEQIVTGESSTATKTIGDEVFAGSIPVDGALSVRATGVGSDSTLGRFAALLEEARSAKGHYQRLADRVAALFVPAAVLLAVIGGSLGLARGGIDEAIMSALAVLLIACPCALGIATPLAIWMGMGQAAKGGALLRNSEALERLAAVSCMCFDKTGTLTTNRPTVESMEINRAAGQDKNRLLAIAAGLAESSTHAFSQSICTFARQQNVSAATIGNATTVAGRGVTGVHDGTEVCLGNVELMAEQGLDFEPQLRSAADTITGAGHSIVCLGLAKAVVVVMSLSETIRAHAAEAISELRTLGCEISALTGDHQLRAAAVGRELNIEVAAQLKPLDKIDLLHRRHNQGNVVAMVGDGLNDAPALAAADVGIALGCGADLTRESADICLLGDDLKSIPWLIELSRRTVRTIKVNLFWAFVYNLIGIGLAISGVLNPIIAAGAMVLSSLFVVGNSLRLTGIRQQE